MMTTRQIKVLEATYIEEADSILVIGEYEEGGKMRHQIHSDCFMFGDKDVKTEMIKTAELMIGKKINIAFDPKKKHD